MELMGLTWGGLKSCIMTRGEVYVTPGGTIMMLELLAGENSILILQHTIIL